MVLALESENSERKQFRVHKTTQWLDVCLLPTGGGRWGGRREEGHRSPHLGNCLESQVCLLVRLLFLPLGDIPPVSPLQGKSFILTRFYSR